MAPGARSGRAGAGGKGAESVCARAGGTLPAGLVSQATTAPRGAQNVWRLWFDARPVLPAALRGVTKSGKPKQGDPALPPNINERTRMHWRKERRLTGYWRAQAFAVAKQWGVTSCQRIRITAVIHRVRATGADQSGDAERLKPLIDGLVDAGVIPDDTYRYIEHGGVSQVKAPNAGVLLIVEALEV
jgi:hypothetical protein